MADARRPLGGVGGPGLDEAAVPGLEPLGRQGTVEGQQREAGRLAPRVPRHEGEALHQGQRVVGRVEVRAARSPSRSAP